MSVPTCVRTEKVRGRQEGKIKCRGGRSSGKREE